MYVTLPTPAAHRFPEEICVRDPTSKAGSEGCLEGSRQRDNNTISLPLDQIDSVTPRYRYSARDTVIIGVTAHIGRIAHMGAIAPCAIKNPGFK